MLFRGVVKEMFQRGDVLAQLPEEGCTRDAAPRMWWHLQLTMRKGCVNSLLTSSASALPLELG